MNALTNNTATLFRRYLWLLNVIYSAGRITLDEIRVRWQRNEMSGGEELPRKTFENHRKAVEELFDVNIACDRRTNEYYVECGDDLVRDDLRRWPYSERWRRTDAWRSSTAIPTMKNEKIVTRSSLTD